MLKLKLPLILSIAFFILLTSCSAIPTDSEQTSLIASTYISPIEENCEELTSYMSSSFTQMCIDDLKNKFSIDDESFIGNTQLYDIDNDGISECLILYQLANGFEICCYRKLNNEIKYCGKSANEENLAFYRYHKIFGGYNANVFDGSEITDYISVLNAEKYNQDDKQYPILCFFDRSLYGNYNFAVKLNLENDEFDLTPIFYWGIEKLIE